MTVNGALDGATVTPIQFVGDVENRISIATTAAFLAKDLFKVSAPYYKEVLEDGSIEIHFTYHFLRELATRLDGTFTGESTYSANELLLYNDYIEYLSGTVKVDETLLACETLVQWLADEANIVAHPELNRDYAVGHPWRKTETREIPWP